MFGKLLQNLFGKPKPVLPDYSVFVTDMHSHLIPGIDDGAQDLEQSVELVLALRELGFSKLITTPHIMSDHYKNTPEIILLGLEELRAELVQRNIDIPIEAAAEYYFDEEFLPKLEKEELLNFGSKYLLFELSYINYPENFPEAVFKLMVKGYKPVLAHPERYPFWFKDLEGLKKLRMSGLLLQINLNSLAGYYGPEPKIMAEKLIAERMVDFIGTDCHNMRHVDALKRALFHKSLAKLAEEGVLNRGL